MRKGSIEAIGALVLASNVGPVCFTGSHVNTGDPLPLPLPRFGLDPIDAAAMHAIEAGNPAPNRTPLAVARPRRGAP